MREASFVPIPDHVSFLTRVFAEYGVLEMTKRPPEPCHAVQDAAARAARSFDQTGHVGQPRFRCVRELGQRREISQDTALALLREECGVPGIHQFPEIESHVFPD